MALTTGAFLSDSGNPSNGNGSDGDHYRDTANQNLWFKAAGSWVLVGNLNDNTPDGIGTIWLNGSGVPLNGNGANGDYYRNTDNQDVWFKQAGIWHLIFGTTQLTSATSGVRSVNGIQPDGNGDVTLLVEDLGGAWPDLPAHVADIDPHGDREQHRAEHEHARHLRQDAAQLVRREEALPVPQDAVVRVHRERDGRDPADGAEPVANTPEQFAAHIKSEIARWAPVVKASGAKPD